MLLLGLGADSWSCRYHHLLGVSIPESICRAGSSEEVPKNGSAILHYVYSCLSAHKVSSKVCSCVMELTINLLSDSDSATEEQVKVVEGPLDNSETDESGNGMEVENTTSGPDLVLPFIPMLLSYMSTVIEREGRKVKQGRESASLQLEFTVISR